MQCKLCGREAVFKSRGIQWCEDCFEKFYLKKVEDTILKYNMFNKDSKVCVAVSGGEDSAALAHALKRLGYNITLLHIHLNIEGYSDQVLKIVEKQAEIIGAPLHVEYLEKYGLKVQRVGYKPPCAVCGVFKRYLMNKFACENDFDVICTGHTIDDLTAFLFSAILTWDIDTMNKLKPFQPSSIENLKPKAKPLAFLLDKEDAFYAKLNGLPIADAKCPFELTSKVKLYKKRLRRIDPRESFRLRWYKVFLNNFPFREEGQSFKKCMVCGFPTIADKCSFCRIKELFQRYQTP